MSSLLVNSLRGLREMHGLAKVTMTDIRWACRPEISRYIPSNPGSVERCEIDPRDCYLIARKNSGLASIS
jgi:hypothetical protein